MIRIIRVEKSKVHKKSPKHTSLDKLEKTKLKLTHYLGISGFLRLFILHLRLVKTQKKC